ncbi:MAG: type IV pilus assembly protein PilM [Candidatus Omnitrophica bacterium]|nr:type IV pilus assembly protein PilM [Candidatus Omnitrophota bacterium]
MKLFRLFKKDQVIGLDIGSSSIKLAQFSGKNGGLELVRADLKEIKTQGDAGRWEQEAVSALKELFKGIDLKKAKIIAAINCPETAVKKIVVPYMPRQELSSGIRLVAKNYFPFPLDSSLLNFEILGEVQEKGIRKYEVLLAETPQKTADRYLSLLARAGLKPAAFVPSSYALHGLAGRLYSDETARCFIDIGESRTELIISRGRRFEFGRKLPISANDFTKAMTAVLVSERGKIQLSFAEAEKIKLETGLPSDSELKLIDDKISTNQILYMMRMPLEQLVSEIERCFDYYREEVKGAQIGSVLLFGGGSELGGLAKALSERIGTEVRLGEALNNASHRMAIASGAALCGAKGINLLPPEIREETRRLLKRGTIEAAGAAAILIAAFIYIGARIEGGNLQKRIEVANLELSGLKPGLKEAGAKALADALLVDEPAWEDVFKELSNITPDYINFTGLDMKNNIITIKGIAAGGEEKNVSKFMLVLEKGMFNSVKLLGTRDMGGAAGIEFELQCRPDQK